MNTLNDEEQEKCRTSMGFFKVLTEKFKPQNTETMSSLQYSKLPRKQNEFAKEWFGHFTIKANEGGYKENEKCLKNNFLIS